MERLTDMVFESKEGESVLIKGQLIVRMLVTSPGEMCPACLRKVPKARSVKAKSERSK